MAGHTHAERIIELLQESPPTQEMVEKVASDAVQIHGGYGYMAEYPVSRHYKSVKVLQIVEGTSEVMRILLSRELGL